MASPNIKNIISLDTAVSEIKQACEKPADGGNGRSPFFFFVGAGISYPSIPLASTVQRECEEKARSLGRLDKPSTADHVETYSHWFRSAFPHRILRQQYLRDLMKDAPITHANLRLADLLSQGTISNIVVTPNFDDLLSRSLTLFGKQYVICDDPRTVERIDPEKSDIQLVHVHGSYWFYDCRNTNEEIRDRALPLAETTLTMAALLDKILTYRAPIVIGYSGWESDVFMTALKRRLLTPLPFNLYWFCYRRDQIDDLPDFLKYHPDVYFIVPPTKVGDDASTEDTSDKDVVKSSSDDTRSEPTLSAVMVLDALIRQIGVQTPDLTKNPLLFFADQLRRDLPPENAEEGRDVYSFRSVIERVERAKLREEQEAKTVKENETQLESVREALRRAQYDEAYDFARQINIKDTTFKEDQLRELMNLMESVSRAMADTSPLKPKTCDLAIDCYDVLEKKKSSQAMPELVLVNLTNIKGCAFYATKVYDEAISSFDLSLSRFAESSNDAVQEQIGVLQNNKGLALRSLQRNEEAIASHDAVIGKLGKSEANSAVNTVAVALAFKAVSLSSLGRHKEAVEMFEQSDKHLLKAKEVTDYTKKSLESTTGVRTSATNIVLAATIAATNVVEKEKLTED